MTLFTGIQSRQIRLQYFPKYCKLMFLVVFSEQLNQHSKVVAECLRGSKVIEAPGNDGMAVVFIHE